VEPENQAPGKLFNVLAAAVAAVAALAGVLILLFLGLSPEDREALERKRQALHQVQSRKGSLPTPRAVKRWKGYRKDLEALREDVEAFFRERDRNLEAYFDEYNPNRTGTDRFRKLYTEEKAPALYETAKPVLIKDANGNPAPMDEVFAFDAWDYTPGREEIRIAQAEFNVRSAVVDIFLDLRAHAETVREAGGRHLDPALVSVRLTYPRDVPPNAVAVSLEVKVEALMDARDVPALVAGVLGPGKHGLLTRLKTLEAVKTQVLPLEFEVKVKEGEEPKIKPEGFVKPIRATLGFEVLDILQED